MKFAVILDVSRLFRELVYAYTERRCAFRQLLHIANRLIQAHFNQTLITLNGSFLFAMDLRQIGLVAHAPILRQDAAFCRRELIIEPVTFLCPTQKCPLHFNSVRIGRRDRDLQFSQVRLLAYRL